MKVKWLGLGVAGGNGLLQYVLVDQDAKNARTAPFKRWADLAAAGGVVVGLAMHFFDFIPEAAEPILYSSIPKAEAAAIDWARQSMGGTAQPAAANYRQQVRSLPAPTGVPMGSPVSRSYFMQESQPLNL